eukprot:TRINITY_DN6331_c0_g1_i1.p1 TRINITY_DN6331_c0_g1~~TRINITY_DN6331_c0_g1_i1.p1  ORF type:complete len:168 (-),score=18.27 TRINITY_DN6331_c0_g1_i1:299-802(-)
MRLSGNGWNSICDIEGAWDASITAVCSELKMEGVLFDADDREPGLQKSVSFHDMGPRMLSNLWSAIYDAVIYSKPIRGRSGKVGQQIAKKLGIGLPGPRLPPLPNDPLLNVVQDDSDDETEDDQNINDPRPLPQCYKELRQQSRGVQYMLSYKITAVDVDQSAKQSC